MLTGCKSDGNFRFCAFLLGPVDGFQEVGDKLNGKSPKKDPNCLGL